MSITFLIPIYNEVKTVREAIEEAINISIPSKEIIIIDNGSNDGSQNIIKEYEQYKNVKIILHDKNLGFGNSIREGFLLSSKKFIYLQFGDLEYDIKSSQEMLKLIEEKNLDAIFGSRLRNIHTKFKLFKIIIQKPTYLATIICTFLINIFYNKNFTDIIGGKLYRKETIKCALPKISGAGFDFEFVSLICKKKLYIEEVFINYKPREIFSDKKIKFYHMLNAIYGIIKIKFFIK